MLIVGLGQDHGHNHVNGQDHGHNHVNGQDHAHSWVRSGSWS
jgi:hypothetical protein